MWTAFVMLSAAVLGPLAAAAQTAGPAERLAFVPYAAAFSLEAKEPELVDPLVFVIAPHAPAATGLLGIAHLPGVRNALMVDDPMEPALDADGKPLGFDLQHWFAGTGIVEILEDNSGREHITARFTNLVPNGRYSLYASREARVGAGVVPLDGNGHTNSFVAAPDGTGGITLVSPTTLGRRNAILLVFHSDRTEGGQLRGDLGIYSHVQLAAPIP